MSVKSTVAGANQGAQIQTNVRNCKIRVATSWKAYVDDKFRHPHCRRRLYRRRWGILFGWCRSRLDNAQTRPRLPALSKMFLFTFPLCKRCREHPASAHSKPARLGGRLVCAANSQAPALGYCRHCTGCASRLKSDRVKIVRLIEDYLEGP